MAFFKSLFSSKKNQNREKKNIEIDTSDKVAAMASRDSYQDALYFSCFLQRIEPFASRTLNGYNDAKKNNHEAGMKNWARGLSEGIYVMPSIWYSIGATINKDWQSFYLDNIKYYQESISRDLINGSYHLSLKILALGILLNIDKDVFRKISQRYVEEGYEDYILDSLIHSQYDKHPVSSTLQFPQEKYIQKLSEILKSNSSNKTEAIIKDTLDNYFYTSENLQTSYDSHKTEFYSGYWAWELGALVKITGFDDSSFKSHRFYPSDMVHW